MKFAKWVFLIAGIYGILVTAPLYFYEAQLARDMPPALNHPEYYYGFAGGTLAWQIVFIILSRDPARYRLLMLPALVEKFSYVIAIAVLAAQQRVPGMMVGFSLVDLVWGVLFLIAFWKTRTRS